jgi:hypothetical protein
VADFALFTKAQGNRTAMEPIPATSIMSLLEMSEQGFLTVIIEYVGYETTDHKV